MPKSTGSSTPRENMHTPREGSRGAALVEEASRVRGTALVDEAGRVGGHAAPVPATPALDVLSGGEEDPTSGLEDVGLEDGEEEQEADEEDEDQGSDGTEEKRMETDRQRAAAERNAAYVAAEREMQRDRAALAESRPLEATRMCCEWLDSLIHVLCAHTQPPLPPSRSTPHRAGGGSSLSAAPTAQPRPQSDARTRGKPRLSRLPPILTQRLHITDPRVPTLLPLAPLFLLSAQMRTWRSSWTGG